ncbi:TRAP-type C4-dicarboxylate transport system, periplasmic component [Desulfosporosinus orientis DSM 765]|uniref:TRAP-type C4-dicarboxylate transport system, periplasmic component n=1 Tax=Desulfosporosinus orientis (strain ATCC 19365 / DSM 765 / NCIMB 8382 / VKM B-1628 / Singapore I) TaxID=768706 RepID=G7WG02_DESOD|nr:TRAP transporter substrate-binding protein [Desulfosporosinus orientis]AET69517.1 TRAP-type C4-dicarboxylate transport system, periplasmic component [Desulfosporosinus orientis DSM 765]
MKKRLCQSRLKSWGRGVFLGLLALSLIMLTGCGQQASAPSEGKSQTVELKLAHFFPATHPAETELIQPWIAAIETATEGRVKITSYPAQTLLQADAVYDGVVNGIADLGLSCFSYTRGSFPVLEVFELPGIKYVNSKAASKVAWEGIKEINPKEVQDTKLMMVFTTGPGDLYTKEPVRSLQDLKGLEIRATGLSAKSLSALGASPVAMAQSEAYEALSKGVVKGNLGPIEVLQGWKQAEVTKYLTRTPFLYNNLFYITMNLDKWNSISSEDQQAIEKVNEKFFEDVAMGLWDKQNEAALKYAVDEKGMEVINLSSEEQEKWIDTIKPIQDDYVAQMKEKGENGQEILDKVKSLAEEYNKEYQ